MPNPTVRRERVVVHNADGTVTETFRNIRENGDRSEMVFYKQSDGTKRVIWHVVFDAAGLLLHGPHEKYRLAADTTEWPPVGYA